MKKISLWIGVGLLVVVLAVVGGGIALAQEDTEGDMIAQCNAMMAEHHGGQTMGSGGMMGSGGGPGMMGSGAGPGMMGGGAGPGMMGGWGW